MGNQMTVEVGSFFVATSRLVVATELLCRWWAPSRPLLFVIWQAYGSCFIDVSLWLFNTNSGSRPLSNGTGWHFEQRVQLHISSASMRFALRSWFLFHWNSRRPNLTFQTVLPYAHVQHPGWSNSWWTSIMQSLGPTNFAVSWRKLHYPLRSFDMSMDKPPVSDDFPVPSWIARG